MTFGTEWGFGSDLEESRRILDVYAERGGNFLDTANIYTGGSSESYIGQILQNRRDRFVIATKYSLNTDPTNPNAGGSPMAVSVMDGKTSIESGFSVYK
jgi:aryl-alcohol dehydrogenase-like predicted oxidoreductase